MAELHDRSHRQELRTASLAGGRVVSRSGAGWKVKGDVRTAKTLFEMKRTDNKRSITIKAEDLEMNRRHASQTGRRSVLGFELNGRTYWVFGDADGLRAIELLDEDES